MTDRTVQVGGHHYIAMTIQPLEVMEAAMTTHEMRGFLWGNVIKYAMRWQKKGGVEDLRKLRHYTDLLIEHEVEG